jgi:hypothetical protein
MQRSKPQCYSIASSSSAIASTRRHRRLGGLWYNPDRILPDEIHHVIDGPSL